MVSEGDEGCLTKRGETRVTVVRVLIISIAFARQQCGEELLVRWEACSGMMSASLPLPKVHSVHNICHSSCLRLLGAMLRCESGEKSGTTCWKVPGGHRHVCTW